jgi:hypothetical protein
MRLMTRAVRIAAITGLVVVTALPAHAQEARRRWEMERQIRLDKFEQVLPRAMRDNGIDMWIVAVKENHYDPLWKDLGRGYVTGIGYYVFTDRGGDRIERVALGPSGYLLSESGAYDEIAEASKLAEFLRQRDPKRIGVNMSDEIAGRAVRQPPGERGEARLGVPVAPRRVGDSRVRRGRRHRDPADRTGALE